MKHTSIRTPLAKVRGLGSARDGTRHFLWKRITALLLIPLTLWLMVTLLRVTQADTAESLSDWLGSGFSATALVLLLAGGFYHSKLGVQTVIEDYVHGPFGKTTLLLLSLLGHFTLAALGILAVLRLHLHLLPGV
jgi:succinate dehydrogenase / fumarate reductase membrane anchor subunit